MPQVDQLAQSESFEESDPLEYSSLFAEVEGLPWMWLSSLLLVRGLPGLDRILEPMGKGSYRYKKSCQLVHLAK